MIAAPQAHLQLWTMPETLAQATDVLRTWGFHLASYLAWSTIPGSYGDYWRHPPELLLLGVRGKMTFRDNSLPGLVERNVRNGDRSREIREIIARVSPPPYLDLFGDCPVPGWTLATAAPTEEKLALKARPRADLHCA